MFICVQSEMKSEMEQVAQQMPRPNSQQSGPFSGTSDGASVQKLWSVSSKMRALPLSQLQKLYEQFVGQSSSSNNVQQQIKK